MKYIDTLLQKLTSATGIGYSGNVQTVVQQELQKNKINASITDDGSVIGHLKGQSKAGIMIACHLDEVGFMVSSIDDAGRIKMSQVGGVDVRILPGQEVIIHGEKDMKGYIGAKPPHLMTYDEYKKVIPMEKLFIDTGFDAKTVKKSVKIGDYVSFNATYQKLQGELRTTKSIDNRASVACGLLVLKELSQIELTKNIYFVATSQEEYTGLGARIHSYKLPVHYAIVVDTTFGEYPGSSDSECFPLNSGPVIARGPTIPERMYKIFVEAAKELEISYQIEPLPIHSNTDAEEIAFNREGIPTCIVGIPVRYLHTPVEVVSLKDIDRTKRLICHGIKKIDELKTY